MVVKILEKYSILIGVNLIYACVSIFTRIASEYEMFSMQYTIGVFGAICVLGIYAVIWQQILKRFPVGEAYMYKGTSVVFVLLLATLVFNDTISCANIIGAVIIVCGIGLYSRL